MKKLLLAAVVVLMASPAFAAVQNVQVSGDITMSYLNRQNFDAGIDADSLLSSHTFNNTGLSAQSAWLTQTRLRVDADLTDNVSATVRLINEAVWDGNYGDGTGNSSNDVTAVDIDLAYVTLHEFLYSPLTLTVGRQEIVMGNGLIIGGGPNEFTSGHFNGIANDLSEVIAVDGIKAVLDYRPLTLTGFWYKNDQAENSIQGLYPDGDQNSDVLGIEANYQFRDPYNTIVEGYLFSRIDGKDLYTYTVVKEMDKNDTLFVPGLRVSTNPIKGLNIQGEVAWQLGQVESVVPGGHFNQQEQRRNAMAAQFLANYVLPVLEQFKPMLNAAFTYVSGDKERGDINADGVEVTAAHSSKARTSWDQFAKNQNAGTIYNALFPLSDMYIYSLGATVNPAQDLTVAFTWSDLYAAEPLTNAGCTGSTSSGFDCDPGGNALYVYQPNQNSNTFTLIPTKNSQNRGLGNEYDVNFSYDYSEDVTFGLSLGWFAWGDAFGRSVPGGHGVGNIGINLTTASQVIADIGVKF